MIKTYLYTKDGKQIFTFDKDGKLISAKTKNKIVCIPTEVLGDLINKFYNSPEKLTIYRKRSLFSTMYELGDKLDYLTNRNPIEILRKIKDPNLLEMENQSYDEVLKYTNKILAERAKSPKTCLSVKFGLLDSDRFFYHEMGHLQDVGKNMTEFIAAPDDKWGALRYFEGKSSDEVKKMKPKLKTFLESKEMQNTASQVSNYAIEGEGEFIAETYARLISGLGCSEKVMAMYRRCNGPEIALIPETFKNIN